MKKSGKRKNQSQQKEVSKGNRSLHQKTVDEDVPGGKEKVAKCKQEGAAHVERWFNMTLDKGVNKMREEFAEMKRYCPPDMNVSTFTANWEAGRNRYKDVPCQDKARVVVQWPGISYDYIHANYVPTPNSDKRYICTQGPLDATVADFWHMVILERSENLIMLCNTKEKGMDKCAQYWPLQVNESQTYGDVTVVNTGVSALTEQDKNVQRTILKLTWKGGKNQSLEVRHFQWLDWPDRGVPVCGDAVFTLLSAVRGAKQPIIVHCSAGIGRTGSIVAIAFILERFQNGEPCEEMPVIFKTLRDYRPYSIQNDLQYLFVHRVILYYFAERHKKFDKNDARYVKFVDDYNKAVA